jgi:chemotaxis protein CheX
MDQRLAECFTSAAQEVLREYGLAVIKVGTTPVKDVHTDERTVLATVGLIGDASGSLLLRLQMETAANIIAAMYRSLGVEGRHHPEDRETAIGEIANQITGRALTHLSRRAVHCDMTPPAVITGTDVTTTLPGLGNLEYRSLEGRFGTLLLMLGVRP